MNWSTDYPAEAASLAKLGLDGAMPTPPSPPPSETCPQADQQMGSKMKNGYPPLLST